MITAFAIKAAQTKAKQIKADVFLSDDTGKRLGWRLLLRCMPSGSATWIFRYTFNGKRQQINIGNLQNLDLSSARRAANDYADIYKDTPDVIGKLHALKIEQEEAVKAKQAQINAELENRQKQEKYTLSSLMALYAEYLHKQGKVTTSRDVISLSKHLSDLANKPAANVSKRDLVAVQRTLLDAGKGRTANKLRSFVRAAYSLALRSDSDATAPAAALDFITVGGVETNPAALLAVASGYNKTRNRVLSDTEFFMLLDEANHSGATGLAVRAAILLGGQRMTQLVRATTADVQDDFLILLDSKGKRNQPRKHPIPLEGMAGEIIDEALDSAKSLNTKWLFSSNGKTQLHRDTVSKYIADLSAKFRADGISDSPFGLADLRRTIETRLAGMSVSEKTRAHLQSHGLGSLQTRHYDRHEYEQEKRDALRLLHKWINTRGKRKFVLTTVIQDVSE